MKLEDHLYYGSICTMLFVALMACGGCFRVSPLPKGVSPGSVTLPSVTQTAPTLPAPVAPVATAPAPSPIAKFFHRDAPAAPVTGSVTTPPAVSQPAPVAPVPGPVATATGEIQKVVNGFVGLFILAALAGIGFGAFLIYSGHYVSGIQWVGGGLGLAIFGIWFAFHWLLIVSLALLATGLFFLATHYAIVKPILEKIEAAGLSFEQTVMKKL
jgi:hypothetical protein